MGTLVPVKVDAIKSYLVFTKKLITSQEEKDEFTPHFFMYNNMNLILKNEENVFSILSSR